MENRAEYTKEYLKILYEKLVEDPPKRITIKEEDLIGLAKIIEARPYGELTAVWYPQKPTQAGRLEIKISWYTLHRKNYAAYKTSRGPSLWLDKFGSKRPGPRFMVKEERYNRHDAWYDTFPDRYAEFAHKRYKHDLKTAGVVLPPDTQTIIRIVDKRYGIYLVVSHCTILDRLGLPKEMEHISSILKRLGINPPSSDNGKKSWDKIAAQLVLKNLAK